MLVVDPRVPKMRFFHTAFPSIDPASSFFNRALSASNAFRRLVVR